MNLLQCVVIMAMFYKAHCQCYEKRRNSTCAKIKGEASHLCNLHIQNPKSITKEYLLVIYPTFEDTNTDGGIYGQHANWYHIKHASVPTQSRLISSTIGSLPEPDPVCLSSISGFFPMIIPAWSSPMAAPCISFPLKGPPT